MDILVFKFLFLMMCLRVGMCMSVQVNGGVRSDGTQVTAVMNLQMWTLKTKLMSPA